MKRRLRSIGGTPIEEAPLWALAILVGVLWLVAFSGLVGLLNGLDLVRGGGSTVALAAAALALLLVFGLARQKGWRRPGPGEASTAPHFARFSTWVIVMLLVPNVIYGILVLERGGEGLDYASAWAIGLLISTVHGAFALQERWRRRRRA